MRTHGTTFAVEQRVVSGQAAELFARDAFSFWEPFDARFFALTARYARANGVLYASPFWMTYFWATVAYGPTTSELPYAKLSATTNAAAVDAIRAGTFTPTGLAYRDAIR